MVFIVVSTVSSPLKDATPNRITINFITILVLVSYTCHCLLIIVYLSLVRFTCHIKSHTYYLLPNPSVLCMDLGNKIIIMAY